VALYNLSKALSKAERWFAWLQRAAIITVALALAFLMVVQIVLRYGLEMPFLGIEETSVLLGLWLYFLGAVYVTREEAHIKGGIASLVIRNPIKLAWLRLVGTLLCLVSTCVFSYYAYKYAAFTFNIGRKSSYLSWPTILWVASMLFGFVMMLLYFTLQGIRQWRAIRSRNLGD
jgi:TRAP-type C4-dicarboxylate transport system permease small subunit